MWIFTNLLVFIGGLRITAVDGANLRCYDGSFDQYTVYSLDEPEPYLNSKFFNIGNKTVIYAAGFKHVATGDSVKGIVEACLSLSLNVCLLNWEKEASGGGFDEVIAYPLAVRQAIIVGRKLSEAVSKLVAAGLALVNITFIGFSLGASLMGFSANEYQRKTGQQYYIIFGCDPAGPIFDGPISLPSLDARDAKFVLNIHTNPGGMGTDEAAATVDVWPNCGNRVQPGCKDAGAGIGIVTPEILTTAFIDRCSHDLSWMYLSEAFIRRDTFIARSAPSCEDWKKGDGGNQTFSLGFNIDTSLRGQFYLATNASPFYGRGEAGSNPP